MRSIPEIFDISFDEQAFGFLGIIHFSSLFPNQILVCATGFCNSISLFIWRFTFSELFKQKQSNKWVGRYIGRSLCMSQDQQNYSLIIHDKFEDLFTTVT